jgi:hypothetical protein
VSFCKEDRRTGHARLVFEMMSNCQMQPHQLSLASATLFLSAFMFP